MGIDPNNHKPHQSFPRSHASTEGASTSESMNKVPFFKSSGVAASDHRISFTKEETAIISSSSPPLNLDLTIALPSPMLRAAEE